MFYLLIQRSVLDAHGLYEGQELTTLPDGRVVLPLSSLRFFDFDIEDADIVREQYINQLNKAQ